MEPLKPRLKHVGLIPDGARRWARQNDCSFSKAYRLTMDKVGAFLRIMFEQGIEAVSVYLASSDNFRKRTAGEVDEFVRAETYFSSDILPAIAASYSCRIQIAADTELLPHVYAASLQRLKSDTVRNSQHRLYILAGYDPIAELLYALKKTDSLEGILDCLWVPEPVDAVIRTGGAKRLSGFLPLQCSYAELVFLDSYFLEITEERFATQIESVRQRERRFGR